METKLKPNEKFGWIYKTYCKIDKNIIEVIKKNPHTGQFFCEFSKISRNNKNEDFHGIIYYQGKNDINEKNIYHEIKKIIGYKNNKYFRLLTDEIPRIKYIGTLNFAFTTIHWGQRKLLLSEIEFLTNYTNKEDKFTIIYAGSAAGTHINLIAEMFPNFYYILLDRNPFNPELFTKKNIRIIQDYIDKKMAARLLDDTKGQKLLFISDIRRDINGMTTEESDNIVYEDMILQKNIIKQLNAEYSMIKMRFPFEKFKKMKFLEGEIYFQAYAPVISTETRLIIKKNAKEKTYDIKKYEEQLSYFNRILRCQYYDHDYNVKGMDHCYDCRTEFYILEKYFEKYIKNGDIKEYVENMSIKITEFITKYDKNKFILSYEIK